MASTSITVTNKIQIGSNTYSTIKVGTTPIYRVKVGDDVVYDRWDFEFNASGSINVPVTGGNMSSEIDALVTSKYTGYTGPSKTIGGDCGYSASKTSWTSNAQQTTSKSGYLTLQQDTSSLELQNAISWTQPADYYRTITAITSITLTLGTPATIPASGGSVNSCTYSVIGYGYTYKHWNTGGDTDISTGNWEISGETTVNFTGVTANSKGTTQSDYTTAGTMYAKATYGSLSDSKYVYVKQAPNSAGEPTYGSLVITCDITQHPSIIPASGGTVSGLSDNYITAYITGYTPYTSGAIASAQTNPDVTLNITGVTANSKGTTQSDYTTAGTMYVTGSWSGKTSNKVNIYVRQQYNTAETTTWKTLRYYMNVPEYIPASGGSVGSTTITDGRLSGEIKYTSNATSSTSTETTVPSNAVSWGSAATENGAVSWGSPVSAGTRGTEEG